jgi:O-antigen/teichoic acid export membrane protein
MIIDGIWVAGGRVFELIISFAVSMLLARLLPPEELGNYFLTMSILSVGTIIAQLGLPQIAVKRVAEARGLRAAGTLKSVIYEIVLWGSLGTVGVAFIFSTAGKLWGYPNGLILISMLLLAAMTWQILLAEILRGFRDLRAATICGSFLSRLVFFLLILVAWLLGKRFLLVEVLIMTSVGVIISTLMAVWAIRANLNSVSLWGQSTTDQKEPLLILQAWPLMANNLIWMVVGQLDIWVLSIYRPAADVAVYGVITRLAGLLMMPENIVKAVVSPRISQLNIQKRHIELESLMRCTSTLATLSVFAVALIYLFSGGSLLELFFGDLYRTGMTALIFFSLGRLIATGTGLAATTLIMTGHQHEVMYVTIGRGVFTAASCMLLVQKFGMTGVAGAVSAGMVLQNSLMLLLTHRRVGISTCIEPNWRRFLRDYETIADSGKWKFRA